MTKFYAIPSMAALTACALLLGATPVAAQGFTLQFQNGLVTLEAHDLSVPKILELWSRIGRTTVVNGDKIDGLPVTLQLVNVPEREALAILLRNVGGYILAPRPEDAQGVSVFDRIFVVQANRMAMRDPLPQAVVQPTFSPPPPDNAEFDPPIPNQPAGGAVPVASPATAPASGAMPFAPQGVGNRGTPGMPSNVPAGTARPGELTAPPPPPPTRLSPGPKRPPEGS